MNTEIVTKDKVTRKLRFVWMTLAIIMLTVLILSGCAAPTQDASDPSTLPSSKPAESQSTAKGEDITISKNDITETTTFIPYQSGDIKMEVIAVKAPDGSIRTAFNTCQVCFDSGRGYYKQDGDVLICQNCGNQFEISQIEKEKNGCNPVPILSEDKQENGDTIIIPADLLSEYSVLFTKWKR